MIWFTWRQFRTPTWITVGALAALGVVLVITGRSIVDAYDAANVAACGSNCPAAIDNFLREVRTSTSGTVYDLANMLMLVGPALIGIFWGAPLLARELETGTHRLAWNQSVTRTRWLATKLVIIGGVAALTAGVLSWAVGTWADHIDNAAGNRITPGLFSSRGIVPIGYALFAFVLGVTLGMLIRRTVPAMAATLGIYSAAAISMTEWIRAHLVPANHTIKPLDISSPGSLETLMINPDTNQVTVLGSTNLPDAWVLSNQSVTDAGQVFTGPVNWQYCGEAQSPEVCRNWVDSLGLRQKLSYHPADHFWPIQWIETGILIGVAALLAGFCFWWIRRRVS
jgi:ABC-2 family transporter protein